MIGHPAAAGLLYGTTDPFEHPLVLPAWARGVPVLADAIDAGLAKRRAAGLPVDGSVPADCEKKADVEFAKEIRVDQDEHGAPRIASSCGHPGCLGRHTVPGETCC